MKNQNQKENDQHIRPKSCSHITILETRSSKCSYLCMTLKRNTCIKANNSLYSWHCHLYPLFANTLVLHRYIMVGSPYKRKTTSNYCLYLSANLILVSKSCWMKNLLLALHCPITKATLVYCDNINAMYLFDNSVQHKH